MPRNAVVEPTVVEDWIFESYDFVASRRRLVAVPPIARLHNVPGRTVIAVPPRRRLFNVPPGA